MDVGSVEVVSVEASRAGLRALVGETVRVGYEVEFEIDRERLSPGKTLAAVREHLGQEEAAELARRYLEELETVVMPQSTKADGDSSTAAAPSGLMIQGGVYSIGLDVPEARFYNESPRFEISLASFRIDATPEGPVGADFAEAQAGCEARGMRLPTEFEWEVAASRPGFSSEDRFEWTSSWYLPYPDNHRPEEEYGKRYRTLRGAAKDGALRPAERHFLDPVERHSRVGFRCAVSATATSRPGPSG